MQYWQTNYYNLKGHLNIHFAAICANNAVRLTDCECMSARKTGMSRATNWSVLREYKKADIHPLTYVR